MMQGAILRTNAPARAPSAGPKVPPYPLLILSLLFFALTACQSIETDAHTTSSPARLRMAGGSATGNALELLREDNQPSSSASRNEPPMLPPLPAVSPTGQGAYQPLPHSPPPDSSAPARTAPSVRIHYLSPASLQFPPGVRPGDTLIYQKGSYRDPRLLPPSSLHGTAAAPITLRSEPGENVVFELDAPLLLRGARYWKIQNLDFTFTGKQGGIVLQNCHHLHFDSIQVKNSPQSALYAEGGTDLRITRSLLHGNQESALRLASSEGLFPDSLVLSGNRLESNSGMLLQLEGATHCLIAENTLNARRPARALLAMGHSPQLGCQFTHNQFTALSTALFSEAPSAAQLAAFQENQFYQNGKRSPSLTRWLSKNSNRWLDAPPAR